MYISRVDDLRFDWDPAKARLNQRKHGIAFEEAQTVFADEDAILLYRADDGVVRLISARKATPTERAQYDARWTR